MFKCVKCNSPTRMMGNMIVCAPSNMYGNFTKKNMSKSSFEIWGVNWDSFDFICTNEKCGHVTNRMENQNER